MGTPSTRSTANPLAATIGAICILLVTTLFFFLYDFFVNRELTGKNETLDARRQFMRFVSHEVRILITVLDCSLWRIAKCAMLTH